MFKSFIIASVRTMSSERKIKETLAKKLSGKKVSRTTTTNVDQAENKSQFFKELKNENRSNRNEKAKAEYPRNELINIESNVTTRKRSIRTIKTEPEGTEMKGTSSLEIFTETAVKTPKTRNKTKNNEEKVLEDDKTSNEIISPLKTEEDEPCNSKKNKQELSNEIWQPSKWLIALENIRNMRANNKAPVDTMGCHKCADENADEKTQRFHKLVALMLSSQTKDETTYHAMLRLRENNLIPEVICNMKLNVLENILHPVSFYKNKAKYLQQTSKILVDKYNSDIPDNIKELVVLPGVGPKMAHICMSTAWHKVTGIGVDVHVHRISNRMGWVPKPTKQPEQTRLALEAWLPQHLWSEVNHFLVGFGQTICTPVKPKCSECLNCEICPSASKKAEKQKVLNNSNTEVLNICEKVKFKKTKIHT